MSMGCGCHCRNSWVPCQQLDPGRPTCMSVDSLYGVGEGISVAICSRSSNDSVPSSSRRACIWSCLRLQACCYISCMLIGAAHMHDATLQPNITLW